MKTLFEQQRLPKLIIHIHCSISSLNAPDFFFWYNPKRDRCVFMPKFIKRCEDGLMKKRSDAFAVKAP